MAKQKLLFSNLLKTGTGSGCIVLCLIPLMLLFSGLARATDILPNSPINLQQQRAEEPLGSTKQEMFSSLPLSPGDLVKITIPGKGGEDFTGQYEVNLEGNLEIPYLDPLPVLGMQREEVARKLQAILLEKKFFRPDLLRVSVQVLEYSAIQVTVTGEVFQPGRFLINERNTSSTTASVFTNAPGDNPLNRFLTIALQAAGGVKPTADLNKIEIVRNGKSLGIVDIQGILTGESVADVPLVAGDHIIVPNAGKFQQALVRPSQITPQQIPLYISNLTDPTEGRLNVQGSQQNSVNFTYGTRFSQVVIAAQCIGGSAVSNAARTAVLVRSEPAIGSEKTLAIAVEDLLQPSLNDQKNPFLMPYDGIACYDSDAVNFSNFWKLVGDVVAPFSPFLIFFNGR
ncbi:polysaccharide biosynthesis/export family protein [Crocosphaera sp. UHCC 0190]|uniref:polysaccharide biosynthesis/export family protein n=1 Tax=Crocosphaera sp. UHCC 0190 TaxID=3110246 RepID=UPI002B20A1BE|nr:polysaccharide biosynthesis/export family protein [Crocosphaera sp. UHCC 0190]MEA5510556.1 polysaccharide biosynthesis/export family protein [Crocosphaera sp. UHCC 0190]